MPDRSPFDPDSAPEGAAPINTLAARRALLADLEALRDSLDAGDEHVPILDDVVHAPASSPAQVASTPVDSTSTGTGAPAPRSGLQVDSLFDERWRAHTDRLVEQARARVASLRGAADIEPDSGQAGEEALAARVSERLHSELRPALAEMIEQELDALRSALMYRLEEELERLIARIVADDDPPRNDRQQATP